MTASYTSEFDPVLAAEHERIAAQREKRGVPEQPTVGLALSGGGTRSSSFALGVLQGLERGELLRRVDYLSSVSGGGYTGSALTWFRRGGESSFPFGVRGLGIRPGAEAEASWNLTKIVADGLLPVSVSIDSSAGGAKVQEIAGMEINPGIPIPPVEVRHKGRARIDITMGDQREVMAAERVQPPPTSPEYMKAKRSGEAKMSEYIMNGKWVGYTPPPLPER